MSSRLRQFKASYVVSEESTGLGIVEESASLGVGTIAIHSIHIEYAISNVDAQKIILEYIYNRLNNGEIERLVMDRFAKEKAHHIPYMNRIKVVRVSYATGLTYEAHLLSTDALRRKHDLTEVFKEPAKINITELERREGIIK